MILDYHSLVFSLFTCFIQKVQVSVHPPYDTSTIISPAASLCVISAHLGTSAQRTSLFLTQYFWTALLPFVILHLGRLYYFLFILEMQLIKAPSPSGASHYAWLTKPVVFAGKKRIILTSLVQKVHSIVN